MKVLKMNDARHYILYAKGWYKKTDIMNDLKKITSLYTGIDEEFIVNADIVYILMNIVSKHPKFSEKAKNFILDLHPQCMWKFASTLDYKEYDFDRMLAHNCLGYFLVLDKDECEEILGGEIGEPDPKCLQIREWKNDAI